MLLATFVGKEERGRRREGMEREAAAFVSLCVCSVSTVISVYVRACLYVCVTCQPPVNTAQIRIHSSLLLLVRGVLFSTLSGSEPIHFALATMADPDTGSKGEHTAQNIM